MTEMGRARQPEPRSPMFMTGFGLGLDINGVSWLGGVPYIPRSPVSGDREQNVWLRILPRPVAVLADGRLAVHTGGAVTTRGMHTLAAVPTPPIDWFGIDVIDG